MSELFGSDEIDAYLAATSIEIEAPIYDEPNVVLRGIISYLVEPFSEDELLYFRNNCMDKITHPIQVIKRLLATIDELKKG